MKNFLRIGIANLIGFAVALLFVGAMLEATRSNGGYLNSYADWMAFELSGWYGPVQFSVLFGCVCALVVSFIVSHIVEKVLETKK